MLGLRGRPVLGERVIGQTLTLSLALGGECCAHGGPPVDLGAALIQGECSGCVPYPQGLALLSHSLGLPIPLWLPDSVRGQHCEPPVMVVLWAGPRGWLSAGQCAECDAPCHPCGLSWTASFMCADNSVSLTVGREPWALRCVRFACFPLSERRACPPGCLCRPVAPEAQIAVSAFLSTGEEVPRASCPGVSFTTGPRETGFPQQPCHQQAAGQEAAEGALWTAAPWTLWGRKAQRSRRDQSLALLCCSSAPRLPQTLSRPRLEAPSSSVCYFCMGSCQACHRDDATHSALGSC